MWKFFRASAFYAFRAAIGKHEFAHLADSSTTAIAGWTWLLASCILYWICCIQTRLETALTTSISLAILIGLATLKMKGPKQLSVIYTVAGVCLLCTLLQYSTAWLLTSVGTLPMHTATIIWIGMSLKKNSDRFLHLPADMQSNGYRPSTH